MLYHLSHFVSILLLNLFTFRVFLVYIVHVSCYNM
nr:MAG TPA: hypothetical protein [Caudoviricetes sp.]